MGKKYTKKRNQPALDKLAKEIQRTFEQTGVAFAAGIKANEDWAMSWVCDKSSDFLSIPFKGKAFKKVTDTVGDLYSEAYESVVL